MYAQCNTSQLNNLQNMLIKDQVINNFNGVICISLWLVLLKLINSQICTSLKGLWLVTWGRDTPPGGGSGYDMSDMYSAPWTMTLCTAWTTKDIKHYDNFIIPAIFF
jgi:hypothetical protein